MRSKGIILQELLAFFLICLCSSYNDDWMNDSVFSKLPPPCKPQLCFSSESYQRITNIDCDCDEACQRYDTCCIDSPYRALKPIRSCDKRVKCAEIEGTYFASFVVTNCHPRWRRNGMIRSFCQSSSQSYKDPFAMIPVTSTFSNITYKNYFCALCNFDDRQTVIWDFVLESNNLFLRKDFKQEDILRRLEYDESENVWGIWHASNGNEWEFIPIKISAGVPGTLNSIVKKCKPNLKSSCTYTWTDNSVKKMCHSYISPIALPVEKVDDIAYEDFRNPHCALCNFATNFEQSRCIPDPHRGPPVPLSFTLLLDVNPSGGENVGEASTCAQNEVYDPFFKKCRALVCGLPGQTIKNGKCENP